jgi:hypothetical protein
MIVCSLKNKVSSSVLCVSLLLLLSGCLAVAGAAAGAAGLAYFQGALRGTVKANPQQFIAAAKKTLQEMDIKVQGVAADATGGHVYGLTANNQAIVISATSNGNDISDFSIRVGTFGNESLSREIYNRIAARL